MIHSDETFNDTFAYAPRFTDAPGFRMHYIDIGPQDGQVILCLHGEPTWGYLFRHLVAALTDTHRVVVPDHMGFGKSATPQSRTYWLQDHIDNLERFVLALDLRGITLVMHDFGGPVGMGLASRHPERIRRIVSINGPTPFGQSDLMARLTANARVSPWFQWILKAESEGRLEAVLGELGFNILSTLKLNGFENHALIDDTWLRAYGAPFASPGRVHRRDRLGKRLCHGCTSVRGARLGRQAGDPIQAGTRDLGSGRSHAACRAFSAAVQRTVPSGRHTRTGRSRSLQSGRRA